MFNHDDGHLIAKTMGKHSVPSEIAETIDFDIVKCMTGCTILNVALMDYSDAASKCGHAEDAVLVVKEVV